MIEPTPALNEALAKAQGEFLAIKKSKTANVKMNSGGFYHFSYADLADVIAATTPALSKHGLSISMPLTQIDRGTLLWVILRHSSGETISTSLPINIPQGKPQELGSLLSYYRRYLLSSLLNVASEEDDDGNLAQGNEADIRSKAPKQPPKAPKSVEKPLPKPPKIFNMRNPAQVESVTKAFQQAGVSDEDLPLCLDALDGEDMYVHFGPICDKFKQ